MTNETDQAPDAAAASDDAAPSDDPLFQLLLRCYGRSPAVRELEIWSERVRGGLTAQQFVRHLARSPAFTANRQVKVKNPAGHYFSPVVDPDLVVDYVAQARKARIADVAGIDFDLPGMEKFWRDHAAFIAATPFTDTPDGIHRYCFTGGPYNYGDATILRCIINAYRPRQIIEIGSGYSTACMLDAADEAGLTDFQLTCIEPYPTRLKSVLRDTDSARVTIVEHGVQGHDLDRFSQLNRNDILFIDSTHVLKTGSDVHYELFHILPVLKPGVLVHFHDCRWPFEYSNKQIFEKNYSWNEAYGVRALLMYSTRFKVIFHGSLFATERPDLANEVFPTFMKNPGSALWLQVQEF